MVLILYLIQADVPVIIIGDTGCGKTKLIIKLNQLLNNGNTTIEIIKISPKMTDEKLGELMKSLNSKAESQKDEEFWIFFDDINTSLSMTLITEIFIKRTVNGNKLSENIRLIGACNPYRKIKFNKEKFGLSFSDDNDNELVYLVQPLPQSLLNYVLSFGWINGEDEEQYIYNIINPLFSKDEENLIKITKDAIYECHKYLKKIFDPSIVSLRDISRFVKCFKFFEEYFTKKNEFLGRENKEKTNKLRSIICSIYLCYYSRLVDDRKRHNLDSIIQLINKLI